MIRKCSPRRLLLGVWELTAKANGKFPKDFPRLRHSLPTILRSDFKPRIRLKSIRGCFPGNDPRSDMATFGEKHQARSLAVRSSPKYSPLGLQKLRPTAGPAGRQRRGSKCLGFSRATLNCLSLSGSIHLDKDNHTRLAGVGTTVKNELLDAVYSRLVTHGFGGHR